jgi:hypothetical protein
VVQWEGEVMDSLCPLRRKPAMFTIHVTMEITRDMPIPGSEDFVACIGEACAWWIKRAGVDRGACAVASIALDMPDGSK